MAINLESELARIHGMEWDKIPGELERLCHTLHEALELREQALDSLRNAPRF